jgi:ABC-type antimicrobial peptide transport system permease subunit
MYQYRVNPQSFNWTMQTHWPIGMLLFAALSLIALGIVTAVIAARHAAGQAPIAAVRADW